MCSEVLEHVAEPVRLLRNAKSLLAPGCRVIVTVPGGPRSAFDRHIGHHRHFTAADLRGVLTDAGFAVERVHRAGFPFFNLYKLAVIARGRRLIADVEDRAPGAAPSQGRADRGASLRPGLQAQSRRLPARLADGGRGARPAADLA